MNKNYAWPLTTITITTTKTLAIQMLCLMRTKHNILMRTKHNIQPAILKSVATPKIDVY